MRLAAALVSALAVMLVASCDDDGDPLSGTPAAVERVIADHCREKTVRAEVPPDTGYASFLAHAESKLLIRCERPPYAGMFAEFKTPQRLRNALRFARAEGLGVQDLCVAGREAFILDLFGYLDTFPPGAETLSVPVWDAQDHLCKRIHGRPRWVATPIDPDSKRLTYDPHDGSAFNLMFKPKLWSNGGTAGSDNLLNTHWVRWGRSSALGVGTAGLRGPCFTSPTCGSDAYYRAPARVRLDRPRRCFAQGVILRYFSRAAFTVYMRSGNPWDYPVGWRTRMHKVRGGNCVLARPPQRGA